MSNTRVPLPSQESDSPIISFEKAKAAMDPKIKLAINVRAGKYRKALGNAIYPMEPEKEAG